MKPLIDQIICDDCLSILPQIQDSSVDSVIMDSPYNIGYSYNTYSDNLSWDDYYNWQLSIIAEGFRILKTGGSLLWLHYPENAAKMLAIVQEELGDFFLHEWITWIYHQHTGGKPLRKASRVWLWFSKGEPFVNEKCLFGEYRNPNDKRIKVRIDQGLSPVDYDWWFYEQVKNVSSEKVDHPCQLPLAMVLRLVEMVTPPGGVTVDPFAGSGTVCVAAKKLSCHWIGIEKDEKYAADSTQRVADVAADILNYENNNKSK